MQTIAGVRNNLWRRQQSGLYAPNRMNFPLEGLVLYAPLWHPELSGSPIISKDLNAHSCTVIGAIWGPTGRYFDGIDDGIYTAIDATAFGITNAVTFGCWYNPSAVPATVGGLVQILGDAGGNQGCFLNTNQDDVGDPKARSVLVSLRIGTAWKALAVANLLTIGTPSLLVTTYDNAYVRLYQNAVSQGTPVAATGNVTLLADVRAWLGGSTVTAQNSPGTLGDCFVYNHALTVTEIQNIYLATKWRYV